MHGSKQYNYYGRNHVDASMNSSYFAFIITLEIILTFDKKCEFNKMFNFINAKGSLQSLEMLSFVMTGTPENESVWFPFSQQ